jgi:lysophospholipase L1-like esterase
MTAVAFVALATGCGGSPSGPMPSPSPTKAPTYHAAVNVFFDENENGGRDQGESASVPNTEVTIGGGSGVSSAGTGRVELDGVAGGDDPVAVGTLPPFYRPGLPVTLTVPQPPGVEFYVPVDLPIGSNLPGVYMAFGDSITDGDGSNDDQGYRRMLQDKLRKHFRQGSVVNQGIGGTRSTHGSARLPRSLADIQPAYTLILYGTNDWNEPECRSDFPCFTIEALRTMIHQAKSRRSLPVIATITPVNTGYDERTPPERNKWVSDMNDLIRPMAKEEGALLVDMYAAFMAVPDFHTLFFDHVHPNEDGYTIMANEWFKAISRPAVGTQDHEVVPPIMPPHDRYYGDPGRVIGPNEE